jgi:N4-gp56 family major capsid protein
MAFPFDGGYGDAFAVNKSQMAGQNQVLTQWSGEVLRLTQDSLVFPRFFDLAPPGITMGLGKGDTWRAPIFLWNETTAATTALTSGTTIPLITQATLNISGTIDEYGRGIAAENVLEYYVKFGVQGELLQTLANNRALVLNELCRGIIHNTKHVAILGTNGTIYRQLGAASATLANGTITTTQVNQLYDSLKAARVPRWGNGLYVWIGNAAQLRPLKDSGVFQNYSLYNAPMAGYVYQTIGNFGGFTFIETEEGMNATTSYILAPNVAAQAYAKPISLYYYPDFNSDAGRLNVFKWHMLAGFAPILRDYGTRAIRLITT